MTLERRTGLKRTPLERKTPLARGTSTLKRTAFKVTQRAPIPKVGKTVREANKAIARSKPEVRRRSRGRCEFRVRGVCTGKAVHFHHRKLRRHRDHSPANLGHLCNPCHSYAHAHPTESYEKGWLLKSTDDPAEVRWVTES